MLRNYWKLALRNIARYRGFAAINIFGLALGMGSFLLICLHLNDEWSFDGFHADADRMYRVYDERVEGSNAGEKIVPIGLQIPLQVSSAVPEVEAATLVFTFGRRTMSTERFESHEPFTFTTPEFFEVFDFPLLHGDPATALSQPIAVVISESAAMKYYGRTDVVGEVLEVAGSEVEITGVMTAWPQNSHLQQDFLFSLATAEALYPWWETELGEDFSSHNFTTYLKLIPNADPIMVASKMDDWADSHIADSLASSGMLHLQPLADIHLYSADMQEEYNYLPGNSRQLSVFSIVALVILLLASINYTNLATALATHRSREVGMRKVLGSHKRQLVFQFLTESLVLALISLAIGFSLVQLALPWYNQWSGKVLSLSLLQWDTYAILIGIAIGVALMAGSYPAFYLSRFSPAVVMKGIGKKVGRGMGLREVLVMVQFGISGLLVLATAIMFRQLQYLEQKDLGFAKDQQLVVDINSGVARNQFEAIKTEFQSIGAVESVSVSSRVPGEWKNFPVAQVTQPETPEESTDMIYLAADWDFVSTYEMELISGRTFRPGMGDSATVILSESGARNLGISSAQEQEIVIPSVRFGTSVQNAESAYRARVIGIVKDFHFEDLHETLKPVVISFYANPFHAIDYYTLRVSSDNPQQLVADVKAAYARIDPDNPVEYHFLNDQWEAKYRADRQNGQLIAWFAGLGILIASLGLFALASLTIQRRLKEVAIRKVLGSSRARLVRTLSFEFVRLVIISMVVAAPLAWALTRPWLNSFAFRAPVSIGQMLLILVTMIALSTFTVGLRTYRAATQNPVKALRNE